MDQQKPEPVLYILMRNDMGSLTPGKAMAQAAHAANAFVHELGENSLPDELYKHWRSETPQGFGTVIVLSVDEYSLRKTITFCYRSGYPSNFINDPTYPLKDGKVTHKIDVTTCGYIFGDRKDLREYLNCYPLY